MPANDANWALGHKLKNMRIQNGKTLTDVADAIGFTPQFLSMVEKGKSGVSFVNLQKIMALYGHTIADLVENTDTNRRLTHLDQAERVGMDSEGLEALLLYKAEGKDWPQILYFRMEPNSGMGYTQHEGEEFAFVLEGTLEFYLIDPETEVEEKYILGKGDMLKYQSTMKHKIDNTTNKVCTFLIAVF